MYIDELRAEVPSHPPTNKCSDPECLVCGIRDCPHGEPLHYHHDGCPACFFDEENKVVQAVNCIAASPPDTAVETEAHVNPLQIVAAWVEHGDSASPTCRQYLVEWVKRHNAEAIYQGTFTMQMVELAADCLIAAGFGHEQEQQQTVYCRCTY